MGSAFSGCSNLQITASDAPDLTSATDMSGMFQNTTLIGSNISSWDVSNVTNMSAMFTGSTFNLDISSWNVSSVINMTGMFRSASSFNQNISGWTVSNVTTMTQMFLGATSFDQNIGSWNVSNVTSMSNMLDNTALTTANYDATLTGWSALSSLKNNVSLGASGLTYCASSTDRAAIIAAYSWTIIDAGLDCLVPNDPSNLFTNEISASQIDLTWVDNSSDETGFTIERSDGDNSNFLFLNTVGVDCNNI